MSRQLRHGCGSSTTLTAEHGTNLLRSGCNSQLVRDDTNLAYVTGQAQSSALVSVLIAEEYAELALRALHTAYGLDAEE